jgi:hypothetical protein
MVALDEKGQEERGRRPGVEPNEKDSSRNQQAAGGAAHDGEYHKPIKI